MGTHIAHVGDSQKRTVWIMLFGIIFLGTILRFWRFPERIGWWGDIGRDMLVAEHIAEYGEIPVLGHNASGIVPYFYYPPWYYRLLGFLYLTLHSPEGVVVIWTLLQSLTMFFLYGSVLVLFGIRVGLLSILFYAFSNQMVQTSTEMLSAFDAQPFFMAGIFSLIYGIKSNRMVIVFLGIGLVLFASSIFYTILVMFPLILFFIVIALRKDPPRVLLTILYGLVIFSYLYLPLFHFFGFSETIGKFLTTKQFDWHGWFFRTPDLFWLYWKGVFWWNDGSAKAGIVFIGLLFFISLIRGKIGKKILLTMLPIVYLLLVASGKSGIVYGHYFYSLYFLTYIISAQLIISTLDSKINKLIGPMVAAIACAGLFWCFSNGMSYIWTSGGDYKTWEKVGKVLTSEIIRFDEAAGGNTRVTVKTPDTPDWESRRLWYFLESGLKHKLFILNSNGPQWITNEKYHILVCYDKNKNLLFLESSCLDEFIKQGKNLRAIRPIRLSMKRFRGWLLVK